MLRKLYEYKFWGREIYNLPSPQDDVLASGQTEPDCNVSS